MRQLRLDEPSNCGVGGEDTCHAQLGLAEQDSSALGLCVCDREDPPLAWALTPDPRDGGSVGTEVAAVHAACSRRVQCEGCKPEGTVVCPQTWCEAT